MVLSLFHLATINVTENAKPDDDDPLPQEVFEKMVKFMHMRYLSIVINYLHHDTIMGTKRKRIAFDVGRIDEDDDSFIIHFESFELGLMDVTFPTISSRDFQHKVTASLVDNKIIHFSQKYDSNNNTYQMKNGKYILVIRFGNGYYFEPSKIHDPVNKYFKNVILFINKNDNDNEYDEYDIFYKYPKNMFHQQILSQINYIMKEVNYKKAEIKDRRRERGKKRLEDRLCKRMAITKHNIDMEKLLPQLRDYLTEKIGIATKKYLERNSELLSSWALYQFKWKYIENPKLNIINEYHKHFEKDELYPMTEKVIAKKLKKLFNKIKQQCNQCKRNKHKKCPEGKCYNCCTNEKCNIDKSRYPLIPNGHTQKNNDCEEFVTDSGIIMILPNDEK